MPQKKAGSSSVKVLLQNARVRVAEMGLKLGDKGKMIQRPDRVRYIIRGGKIREHFPGGKTKDYQLKAGMVQWCEKSTSAMENVGRSEIHFITVQLK